ncbi:MAG: C1 family peptidase [Gemmatimonadaceae bacterium]
MPMPDRPVFNLMPDAPDARDYRVSAPPPALRVLPPRVDLWEQGIVPEIWNQESLGSCTGHGGGRAHEIERRRQGFAPRRPSRLAIYYFGRALDGTVNHDAGATIRSCIKAMAQYGVPDERLWPYDLTQWDVQPSAEAYVDAERHQLVRYTRLGSVEQICASIAAGRPVVFGFWVYSSFQTGDTPRTGTVVMPPSKEPVLGGHCMCFTGYEITSAGKPRGGVFGKLLDQLLGPRDQDGYLIADNSWGVDWGKSGRCRMPFAFVRAHAWDFWTVEAVEA